MEVTLQHLLIPSIYLGLTIYSIIIILKEIRIYGKDFILDNLPFPVIFWIVITFIMLLITLVNFIPWGLVIFKI